MAIPDPKYQNSAGRLLAILESIPIDRALLDCVPTLFDLPENSQVEKQRSCFIAFGLIREIYDEFQKDISDPGFNQETRDLTQKGLKDLQLAIFPTQLGASFRGINDTEKALLGLTAFALPKQVALGQDDILAIRESIVSLRALVEKGDLSPVLQKVLLDLIRLTEDAISRHNIHGAQGLEKAFKAMLGETAEFYLFTPDESKQEELQKSEAWKVVSKHIKTFGAISSKALKLVPLADLAVRLWLSD